MTVARMHTQRQVQRGKDKPRYTRQKSIARGGNPGGTSAPTTPGVITEISPQALTIDEGDVVMTVGGTGFAPGCQVATGAAFRYVTTFVSATEITFIYPVPDFGATAQFFVMNNPAGATQAEQLWSNLIDVPIE